MVSSVTAIQNSFPNSLVGFITIKVIWSNYIGYKIDNIKATLENYYSKINVSLINLRFAGKDPIDWFVLLDKHQPIISLLHDLRKAEHRLFSSVQLGDRTVF